MQRVVRLLLDELRREQMSLNAMIREKDEGIQEQNELVIQLQDAIEILRQHKGSVQ